MIVNVVGSLIMGLAAAWFAFRSDAGISQHARLLLTTGVLGGFTTFSTFSLDAVLLWERDAYLLFGVYVAGVGGRLDPGALRRVRRRPRDFLKPHASGIAARAFSRTPRTRISPTKASTVKTAPGDERAGRADHVPERRRRSDSRSAARRRSPG